MSDNVMVSIPKEVAVALNGFLARVEMKATEAQTFVQCAAALQQAIQASEQPFPPEETVED